MKLKFEEKIVKIIDSQDFKKFVESIYSGCYDFEALQESNNDSSHKFNVSKKDYFDNDYAEKIRIGNYPDFSIRDVLRCLIEDGHIEEGTYIIDVCW